MHVYTCVCVVVFACSHHKHVLLCACKVVTYDMAQVCACVLCVCTQERIGLYLYLQARPFVFALLMVWLRRPVNHVPVLLVCMYASVNTSVFVSVHTHRKEEHAQCVRTGTRNRVLMQNFLTSATMYLHGSIHACLSVCEHGNNCSCSVDKILQSVAVQKGSSSYAICMHTGSLQKRISRCHQGLIRP
jgi:hypothetical protein